MLQSFQRIVPKLTYTAHKGQAGKVGVIGGSFEYTGAPYYAAISSLKAGADLAHIFCTLGAATPIKSYSPEIIVHPILKTTAELEKGSNSEEVEDQIVRSVADWFKALHVLVIGPGLGRDKLVMNCTKRLIQEAKELKLPLVIDGDGLFLLNTNLDVIRGYSNALLTPNVAEYSRLCKALDIKEEESDSTLQIAKKLGVCIVRKGAADSISDGHGVTECKEPGGPRRCGGQGDVLAGILGTCLAWAANAQKEEFPGKDLAYVPDNKTPSKMMVATYGGCVITRRCANTAVSKFLRGTTTPNIIDQIGVVFESVCPSGIEQGST